MQNKTIEIPLSSQKTVTLKVDSWIQAALYRLNPPEPEVTAFMAKYAKGDILDIGAHVGVHSVALAHLVGPKGRVFAFEPTPTTFKLLKKNCRSLKNVFLFNKAVTQSGKREIHMTDYGIFSAWNTTDSQGRFSSVIDFLLRRLYTKKFTAIAISIDKVLQDQPDIKPKLIKIDVENAELGVLKGGEITIKKFKPAIIFEGGQDKHRSPDTNTKTIIDILKSWGYSFFVYDTEKSKVVPHKVLDFYPIFINILALHASHKK